MNILFTLPDLHFGGTSNLLAQNIAQLKKNNKVYIVFFGPTMTMFEKFKKEGITPVRIKYDGAKDFFMAASALRKFIKKFDIQVVNANLIIDKHIVALSTLNLNVLKVATIHSADTLQANKSFKNKLIFRAENFLHNRVFDKTIVVSEASKKVAIEIRNIKSGKISVVLNGIQPIKRLSSKNESVITEEIIIGTACRFHDIKGLPRLVKLFAELKKHFPVKLILIGDGGNRKHLEGLIEELKLSKDVVITGFVKDVSTYINQLDYYVNSSFSEGMPVSVLEALSIGKPILASNVGGLREMVIDDYNGILVDFSNEYSSLKKVIEFLKHHEDSYKTLSKNAYDSYYKNFSSEIYCKKLLRVYTDP